MLPRSARRLISRRLAGSTASARVSPSSSQLGHQSQSLLRCQTSATPQPGTSASGSLKPGQVSYRRTFTGGHGPEADRHVLDPVDEIGPEPADLAAGPDAGHPLGQGFPPYPHPRGPPASSQP